jgi:hypothetical protein
MDVATNNLPPELIAALERGSDFATQLMAKLNDEEEGIAVGIVDTMWSYLTGTILTDILTTKQLVKNFENLATKKRTTTPLRAITQEELEIGQARGYQLFIGLLDQLTLRKGYADATVISVWCDLTEYLLDHGVAPKQIKKSILYFPLLKLLIHPTSN